MDRWHHCSSIMVALFMVHVMNVLQCAAQATPGLTGMPPAGGLRVAATPQLKAPDNQRYNGSVDSDPMQRAWVQGRYELLPELSRVVGVHVIHVPHSNKYLYMERPSSAPWKTPQIAGTFDIVTREWTPVDTVDGLFCSGHAQTSQGEVTVAGGHKESGGFPSGMRTVRLFGLSRNRTRLVNVTYMSWKRWYPTVTLLPNSQIIIMGGTPTVGGSSGGNPWYEIFDPSDPYKTPLPALEVDPAFVKQSRKMYYPFNFVLPTGDYFTFSERMSRIMVAQTGVYRKTADGKFVAGPSLPTSFLSQYPFTATAAFSKLTPANNYSSVDLMIFGGAPIPALANNTELAGRQVRRMTISWSRTDDSSPWVYNLSNWTIEDMGIPRVMGDSVLLPNGDVMVMNGGQTGVAGDSADAGSRADYPALWAQLYQPDQPIDQRFSTLASSNVARMYHSTSTLTANGTILVTGCDRCFRLHSDVPSFVSSDKGAARFEYRNEIFYPPYFFDLRNKPRILSINNNRQSIGYGEELVLTWNATSGSVDRPPISSITLVAPSSTTHSFNTNQRVVELEVLSSDYSSGIITVRTPPHPYIAPPQWYMVFAINGKVYSSGRWIQLVDKLGQGQVVPQ